MTAASMLSPQAALAQARAWGWPFGVGLAGLALAAVVALALVPQIRREASAVATDADGVARRARHAGADSAQARQAESAPERFLAAFPSADTRQARVAALLALAVHHAMAVRGGEFALGRDKSSGLVRYSVAMPLTGSYAQLRDFIEDALASDAALSLDRLRLRRASPGAAVVEADLTWSFYMRPANAAPPQGTR